METTEAAGMSVNQHLSISQTTYRSWGGEYRVRVFQRHYAPSFSTMVRLSPLWLLIHQFYLSPSDTPTTVQVPTGREHDIMGFRAKAGSKIDAAPY